MELGDLIDAGPPPDPIEVAERFIASKTFEPQGKYYRVSGLYDLCPVREILRETEPRPPETIAPELQMAFMIGSKIHSMMQNWVLGPAKVLWGQWVCDRCRTHSINGFMPDVPCSFCGGHYWRYDEPVLVDEEWKIKGHCDGLLYPPGPWQETLEIKSERGSKTERRASADEKHCFQAQIYNHFLKNRRIRVVYVGKGPHLVGKGKFLNYLLAPDETPWQIATSRIQTIRDIRTGKAELDTTHRICPHPNSIGAKDCQWRDSCFFGSTLKVVKREED